MTPDHEDADPGTVNWDTQIQVVFSVLVGLAFAQIMDLAGGLKFRGPVTLLCAALFFIVLDNWYQLFRELTNFDLSSGVEVFLYALALVPYSGLIFIVGAKANAVVRLDAADWLGLNLIAICVFDALRMTTTVIVRRRAGITDRRMLIQMWKYVFYSATGIVYATILALIVLAVPLGPWSGAGVMVGLWFGIRATDLLFVRKIDLTPRDRSV